MIQQQRRSIKSILYLLHFDVVVPKDLLSPKHFGPGREEKRGQLGCHLYTQQLSVVCAALYWTSHSLWNKWKKENGCLLKHFLCPNFLCCRGMLILTSFFELLKRTQQISVAISKLQLVSCQWTVTLNSDYGCKSAANIKCCLAVWVMNVSNNRKVWWWFPHILAATRSRVMQE